MQELYERYLTTLSRSYPGVASSYDFRTFVSPQLISPFVLELPKLVLEQARAIVAAFFRLRTQALYTSDIAPRFKDPHNFSALMSYDFHWTGDRLKLIEINTNASQALISTELYATQQVPSPLPVEFKSLIIQTFATEYQLASGRSGFPETVLITDNNPLEQKMYVEFLMYQELFTRAGAKCEIVDVPKVQPADLIYNRCTDFYLEQEGNRALRKIVDDGQSCVTPHPHEYELLADKERILRLSQPGGLDKYQLGPTDATMLQNTLISALDVRPEDSELLWQRRKSLFFKPKRSFGGKASYRGGSISRAAFETVLQGQYLAQEYVPAPTWKAPNDQEYKYDLRFYVYRDQVQWCNARLYQGQLTNAQTPGGGCTAIRWS